MCYRAQCSFVVKTGGFLLQIDVQGFNCFLLEWLVSTCLTVAACQSTLYCLVSALVHDSFLLPLWLGVYCLHQAFLRVPFDFKVVLMPRRLHFFSILLISYISGRWWSPLALLFGWKSGGACEQFLRVWFTICAVYPFAWKICFGWFSFPVETRITLYHIYIIYIL